MSVLKLFAIKFVLILFCLFSNSILADCLYNGKWYPEGTIIRNHVCVNGQWIER